MKIHEWLNFVFIKSYNKKCSIFGKKYRIFFYQFFLMFKLVHFVKCSLFMKDLFFISNKRNRLSLSEPIPRYILKRTEKMKKNQYSHKQPLTKKF